MEWFEEEISRNTNLGLKANFIRMKEHEKNKLEIKILDQYGTEFGWVTGMLEVNDFVNCKIYGKSKNRNRVLVIYTLSHIESWKKLRY